MSRNRAGEGGGGAVRVQATATGVRLVDCTIDGCSAPYGGAVFVKDASSVTLVNCDIINCSADPYGVAPQQYGGGIALFPFCSATLSDVRFDNCSATGALSSFGGAIFALQSTVTFIGSDATDAFPTASMTGCHSDFRGGGVYADSCSGTFQRVFVSGCTAGNIGGGLHLEESAFLVQENLITDCAANDGGGISLRSVITGTPPLSQILNNTIYRCSAALTDGAGGGILHDGANNKSLARIAGNLISHTLNGACVRCRRSVGSTGSSKPSINCTTMHVDPANPTTTPIAAVDGSCQQAFASDASNRTGDPLYCAAPAFHLQSCSPDVNSLSALNCFVAAPGRLDRGAAISESHCACGLTSLESATWGRIKSWYR
jgi:hypothetical protein